MFKVHQVVLVSDPVEALENEEGFFQITAPTGQTMEIRLEGQYFHIQGDSYRPEKMRNDHLWQIVKLGELERSDMNMENEGRPRDRRQ